MPTQHLTETQRDTLLLYVLGVLDPEESHAFAAQLHPDCQLCAAEQQAAEQMVALLGYAAPPVPPRPEVRARLLARIALESEAPVDTIPSEPDAGTHVSHFSALRAHEGSWQEFGPGIEVKILSVDPTTKRSTLLVRMAPGTSLPRHRHLDVEEVFVLQGDCHVGTGQILHTGDYFRAEAGSVHETTFTTAGTLFLTLCHNEFLP